MSTINVLHLLPTCNNTHWDGHLINSCIIHEKPQNLNTKRRTTLSEWIGEKNIKQIILLCLCKRTRNELGLDRCLTELFGSFHPRAPTIIFTHLQGEPDICGQFWSNLAEISLLPSQAIRQKPQEASNPFSYHPDIICFYLPCHDYLIYQESI